MKRFIAFFAAAAAAAILLAGCSPEGAESCTLENLPDYSGTAYVELYGNTPAFDEDDYSAEPFESYSELDELGRCGAAYACLSPETMPADGEERGSISSVTPSGWKTYAYDSVDGGYLYNRCHLIGYQLSAENDNEQNLITGTRYMNVDGMLPFENEVASYINVTGCRVLYRVTPIFEGDNLVASGVQMEALSVDDGGEAVCFNVYCYNVQPDIYIDYATGESWPEGSEPPSEADYILNTSSKKFHYPDCSGVESMAEKNKQSYTGSRDELIAQGYSPCGTCRP
ncbi:MAG: DNA/RNA non-specific endonuclease [Oscillospiraceae bacterium]|nr:DNA/RNA non-specific endonuclease [Oscillospiraceae bacterium]